MNYYTDSMKLEADQAARIEDLLRNIAGLDDRVFYISSHAVLVQAVREWRDEARKAMER